MRARVGLSIRLHARPSNISSARHKHRRRIQIKHAVRRRGTISENRTIRRAEQTSLSCVPVTGVGRRLEKKKKIKKTDEQHTRFRVVVRTCGRSSLSRSRRGWPLSLSLLLLLLLLLGELIFVFFFSPNARTIGQWGLPIRRKREMTARDNCRNQTKSPAHVYDIRRSVTPPSVTVDNIAFPCPTYRVKVGVRTKRTVNGTRAFFWKSPKSYWIVHRVSIFP